MAEARSWWGVRDLLGKESAKVNFRHLRKAGSEGIAAGGAGK